MANDLQAPAAKKRERTFLYTVARGAAWLLVRVLAPVRYHNLERFSMEAPYILIANHKSALDPLVMAYPCKNYEIRFLGKKELTSSPFMKFIFDHLHMIPIDRHNMDMAAVRACMAALKNGEILGIYPEGTRHHSGIMEEMEDGVP